MSLSILPAVPTQDLTITDDGHQFFLTLWILASSAPCPHCGQFSSRFHSTYTRRVRDLPWSDAAVSVTLAVPQWWCDNPACPQSIFCMRLNPGVPPYGGRSTRLTEWIADWAWTTSAEEVAATAARHGVTLSASTVVRILRAQPDPTFPPLRIVGIDDWALAKGHRYATVVVDLERHCIIDILPDRTADTVAAWLRQHPSIQTVSRDRAVGYANAAHEGAPQAEQVADRWHLLKNLEKREERFFRRLAPLLRRCRRRTATRGFPLPHRMCLAKKYPPGYDTADAPPSTLCCRAPTGRRRLENIPNGPTIRVRPENGPPRFARIRPADTGIARAAPPPVRPL
jgi:transposase